MSDAERRKRNFGIGYLLGLCGAPRPIAPAQKEPVAYLYDGIRAPKLPELAKNEYMYAVVAYGNLTGAQLFLSKTPIMYRTVNYETPNYAILDELVIGGDYKKYNALSGLTPLKEWELSQSQTELMIMKSSYNGNGQSPARMWANHDVLEDGIVRIAASEPIPVYE